MYIPRHFELAPDRADDLLAAARVAQLVTAHESGPVATLLPVVHQPGEGYGSLIFHLTRTNSQWKDPGLGDALAILSGPDGYVDPEWYPSHADKPSVPTWNYVTVHAYGPLIVHDNPDWTRHAVDLLSADYGFDPNVLDDETMARMLRPIVGVELPITRIEAKAKLNQNKSPEDVAGVIAGLRALGADALASEMEEIALPHAVARYELMAEIKSGRRLGDVRPSR